MHKLLWLICGLFAAAAALGFALAVSKAKVVGRDIALQEITELVYTKASSSYPPDYQRYRFYQTDGQYLFYHETREGFHWPLTEEDITASGTVELTPQQWADFLHCLQGGTVKKKAETADAGGSGPWLTLYWNGDSSRHRSYSFASYSEFSAFAAMCAELAAGQKS